jgi:hypothetical protein
VPGGAVRGSAVWSKTSPCWTDREVVPVPDKDLPKGSCAHHGCWWRTQDGFGTKSWLPVRNRVTCPIWRKACLSGPIRLGWAERLCPLVAMYASRFRNSVCTERNRIGGACKKWGSQRSRATLQREVHAAQEVLEARVGSSSGVSPVRHHGCNGDPCSPPVSGTPCATPGGSPGVVLHSYLLRIAFCFFLYAVYCLPSTA